MANVSRKRAISDVASASCACRCATWGRVNSIILIIFHLFSSPLFFPYNFFSQLKKLQILKQEEPLSLRIWLWICVLWIVQPCYAFESTKHKAARLLNNSFLWQLSALKASAARCWRTPFPGNLLPWKHQASRCWIYSLFWQPLCPCKASSIKMLNLQLFIWQPLPLQAIKHQAANCWITGFFWQPSFCLESIKQQDWWVTAFFFGNLIMPCKHQDVELQLLFFSMDFNFCCISENRSFYTYIFSGLCLSAHCYCVRRMQS